MTEPEREMSASDARAQFADVLSAAMAGRVTYITNRGRRAAMVSPVRSTEREAWLLRTLEGLGDALDQIRVMVGEREGAAASQVATAVQRQLKNNAMIRRVDPDVVELLANAWEHEAAMAETAAAKEEGHEADALRTLARTKRGYAGELRRLIIPPGPESDEYRHWVAVLGE